MVRRHNCQPQESHSWIGLDSKYLELDFFGTQPPRTLMNGDGLDGLTPWCASLTPISGGVFCSFVYPDKMGKSRKIEADSKTVANCSSYLFGQEQDRKTTHWSPLVGQSIAGFGPFWSKSWVQSAAGPRGSAIRKRLPESLQRMPGEVVQIMDENLILLMVINSCYLI